MRGAGGARARVVDLGRILGTFTRPTPTPLNLFFLNFDSTWISYGISKPCMPLACHDHLSLFCLHWIEKKFGAQFCKTIEKNAPIVWTTNNNSLLYMVTQPKSGAIPQVTRSYKETIDFLYSYSSSSCIVVLTPNCWQCNSRISMAILSAIF